MDDQKESVFRPCPSTSFYSNVPRKKIPKRASVRSTPYPTGSASSSPYRKGSQAKTDFTFSPQFKVSWKGRNGQMTVGLPTSRSAFFYDRMTERISKEGYKPKEIIPPNFRPTKRNLPQYKTNKRWGSDESSDEYTSSRLDEASLESSRNQIKPPLSPIGRYSLSKDTGSTKILLEKDEKWSPPSAMKKTKDVSNINSPKSTNNDDNNNNDNINIDSQPFSSASPAVAKKRCCVTLEQVYNDEEEANKENKASYQEYTGYRLPYVRPESNVKALRSGLSNTQQPIRQEPIFNRFKRDPLDLLPLPNIGNSCYMNSALQTLFNCHILMKGIIEAYVDLGPEPQTEDGNNGRHREEEVEGREEGREEEEKEKRKEDGKKETLISMSESLLTLYKKYCRERQKEIFDEKELEEPLLKFKKDVSLVNSEFHHNFQQDAVEFLDCILNSIDDEFVRRQKKNCVVKPNPITDMVKLRLGSTMECINCHQKVELQEQEQHSLILGFPEVCSDAQGNDWSLQHFVDYHFRDEKIEARCPNCPHNERLRRLTIKKAPKILILHLVRYSKDEQKRLERIRIPKLIELPTTEMLTEVEGSQSNVSKDMPEQSSSSTELEQQKLKDYQLVSVICHHGASLRSGHYTSFNFDTRQGQWYKCDDTIISKTDFETMQDDSQQTGYCFMYIDKKFI